MEGLHEARQAAATDKAVGRVGLQDVNMADIIGAMTVKEAAADKEGLKAIMVTKASTKAVVLKAATKAEASMATIAI